MTTTAILRRDGRLTAALLTTAFCWRELSDLLRVPAPTAGCDCTRAALVLDLALARARQSDRVARRIGSRLDRCHARLLEPWRSLPTTTRRHAARTATAGDFSARGIEPAAFLWALATDPDPLVHHCWTGYVRRAFPSLAPHLGLDPV